MNSYVVVALAAVVVILVLRRLQSSGGSSTEVPPDVPRDAEGIKQLMAAGHPFKAVQLAREIAAHDPEKAKAILAELQVHVKIGGTGSGVTIAGLLEPAKDPQIQAFLLSGNKIEAIKRWRDLTGHGLKEAKDAIDGLSGGPPRR